MKDFKDFLKKAGDKIEGMFKTGVEAQEAHKTKMEGHAAEFNKSVINTAKDAYEVAKPTIKVAEEWLKNDFVTMVENHQKAKKEYDARMDKYAEEFGEVVRSTEEYKWLEKNIPILVNQGIELGSQKADELIANVKHGIEIYQLNQAIYAGKAALVNLMIAENKIDINWITPANEHPMVVAVRLKNKEVIEVLKSKHIDCTKCATELIKMLKESGDSEMLKDMTEYINAELNELAGIETESEMKQKEVDAIEEEIQKEMSENGTGDDNVVKEPITDPDLEKTTDTTGDGDQEELNPGGEG